MYIYIYISQHPLTELIGPWEICMKYYISNFQANFSDWWLRHLLWNCPQLMVTGLTDDKSTLGQVSAWCHQATSHYLRQCWPRSMSPYGVTGPQWVNMIWMLYVIWWWKFSWITPNLLGQIAISALIESTVYLQLKLFGEPGVLTVGFILLDCLLDVLMVSCLYRGWIKVSLVARLNWKYLDLQPQFCCINILTLHVVLLI